MSATQESPATPAFFVPALLATLAYGVGVTIWLLPRWGLTGFQVAIYLLAAAWIITAVRRGIAVVHGVPLYAVAAATSWGVVQLVAGRSLYAWVTWEAVLAWMTNLTACFLALQICTEARMRRRFLRGIVYLGLAIAIVATLQAYTSDGAIYWLFPSGYQRVYGPFLSANQFAAFLESIVPIAIVLALRDRRRAMLFTAAAGVMMAAVVASASRAGTLLVFAAAGAALLLAVRARLVPTERRWRVLGQFLAVGATAVLVVGWTGVWSRLQDADPLAVRRQLTDATIAMIADRPVWGTGLGTWSTIYPAYAPFDDGRFVNQAHNDWLQWTAEGGVPFVLCLIVLVLWSLRPATRTIWGVGLLAVFCHAWVDYPMQQRPALAAWFFTLVGVMAAQYYRPAPPAAHGLPAIIETPPIFPDVQPPPRSLPGPATPDLT